MLLSIENRELSLLFEVGLWSQESSLTGVRVPLAPAQNKSMLPDWVILA